MRNDHSIGCWLENSYDVPEWQRLVRAEVAWKGIVMQHGDALFRVENRVNDSWVVIYIHV